MAAELRTGFVAREHHAVAAERTDRKLVLLGALSGAAVLTPFLGAGAAAQLRIHPRVMSYGLIAAAVVIASIRSTKATMSGRSRAVGVTAAFVILGLLLLLQLPAGRPLWLPDEYATTSQFGGYKLTRFILTAVPPAVLGFSVARYARSREFYVGLILGIFIVGAIGVLRVGSQRELWNQLELMFRTGGFSLISMSMIFLFQIIAVGAWASLKPSAVRSISFALVGSMSLLAIILLAQRTFLIIGIVAMVLYFGRLLLAARRTRALFVAMGFVAASLLTVASPDVDVAELESTFFWQSNRLNVSNFIDELTSGTRVDMWRFGLTEGFRDLGGHGTGSFAELAPDFSPDRSQWTTPHNIVVEASFELGILGFVAAAYLVIWSLLIMWRLRSQSESSLYMWGLLAATAFVLKAGDLSSIGIWIFWLYLAECSLRAKSS